MTSIRVRTLQAFTVALALLLASAAVALKERSEADFPLVLAEKRRVLKEPLQKGEEIVLRFAVTNPTSETLTYFSKSSNRTAEVTHKQIDIEPGETQEIEITIKHQIAGPFRHRIGVVVEPTRGAFFIEGSVAE